MTCRRRPFEGKDIIDLAARVLKGEHRPVDDVCVRHIAARFLHGCVLHILSIADFMLHGVLFRALQLFRRAAHSRLRPSLVRQSCVTARCPRAGTPHACGHLPPVSID